METENNVAGWKLHENGDGTVTDWTNGRTGAILPSSGDAWKDVAWNEGA